MKGFLKSLVINGVLAVLGISLLLPLFWLSPLTGNIRFTRGGKGHMLTRLNEIEKFRYEGVLFLGSSHTYRSFDVNFFKYRGVECFNLGSSSQSPDVTGVLVKDYIGHINPKVVVYEVYPEMIFSQRLESRIDVISNISMCRFTSFIDFSLAPIASLNTMILSFWHQVLIPEYAEERVKGQDTYIDGGYVRNENIRTQFDLSKESLSIDLENAGFENLRQNVEYIQDFGAQIVLVYAPLPSDTYSLYKAQNNTIDSLYSSLGVPYINYNGLPLNDTLHFKDDDHLNHAGVQIFNQRLLKDLDSLSVLDIH